MKLPLSVFLNPMIKPLYVESRQFCLHPVFGLSHIYVYMYASLGFLLNFNSLRKNLAKIPMTQNCIVTEDKMLNHDLKIIGYSMGVFQYACLLIGCITKNPAMFLPHLLCQVIIFAMKFSEIIILLIQCNLKSLKEVWSLFASSILMAFNWFQELCVFRQILCICDL